MQKGERRIKKERRKVVSRSCQDFGDLKCEKDVWEKQSRAWF